MNVTFVMQNGVMLNGSVADAGEAEWAWLLSKLIFPPFQPA